MSSSAWPALPLADWKNTCDTLHMWTQIVGKIRLEFAPYLNHWWNAAFYVSARGLTTSAIPHGSDYFEMEFDFLDHQLAIRTSSGASKVAKLRPRTVADFYQEVLALLGVLGIEARINPIPNEVPDPIPFDRDEVHASYDPEYAQRFWRILIQVSQVLTEFRGRFIGKCSPVHFFWGSFDLAVTRFSGPLAPPRPGADRITREAYSHECSSAGFWPGSGDVTEPAFYAYTSPAPPELETAAVRPAQAFYDRKMGEFFLMYEEVRRTASPRDTLLEFLESTYEAGATLAHWNRNALERREGDANRMQSSG